MLQVAAVVVHGVQVMALKVVMVVLEAEDVSFWSIRRTPALDGVENIGGGGGGSGTALSGSRGGSGIVLIAYPS